MNEARPITPLLEQFTPPPELSQQWVFEAHSRHAPPGTCPDTRTIIAHAAQWGADQELEACCEWLDKEINSGWINSGRGLVKQLRTARRPKPPSTIEIAEEMMARHNDGWTPSPGDWVIIRDALADGRRAQEALSSD